MHATRSVGNRQHGSTPRFISVRNIEQNAPGSEQGRARDGGRWWYEVKNKNRREHARKCLVIRESSRGGRDDASTRHAGISDSDACTAPRTRAAQPHEGHDQGLARRRRMALGHRPGRRVGRAGRGRGRVRHLPPALRGVLPRVQGPGRRLSADLGRVHPCIPHALSAQVDLNTRVKVAMPDGPQNMGKRGSQSWPIDSLASAVAAIVVPSYSRNLLCNCISIEALQRARTVHESTYKASINARHRRGFGSQTVLPDCKLTDTEERGTETEREIEAGGRAGQTEMCSRARAGFVMIHRAIKRGIRGQSVGQKLRVISSLTGRARIIETERSFQRRCIDHSAAGACSDDIQMRVLYSLNNSRTSSRKSILLSATK